MLIGWTNKMAGETVKGKKDKRGKKINWFSHHL
jgi:hypothetical protein